MASSRSRQRKLAREKFDRQVARRAATARRRRQTQAGVGAGLALLLIVFGSVWLFGGFRGDDDNPAAANDTCVWSPQNAQANDKLKDVGQPPTKDLPTSGAATMTVTTNQGVVEVALDVANAPCATASFTYLAGQGFFGNTPCHQLLTGTGGMYALRCGDPSGSGTGGPTYTFYDENVPDAPAASASAGSASGAPVGGSQGSASAAGDPSASASAAAGNLVYPKGTVAMATDTPGANGSQFFIFYQDSKPQSGQYSIIGTVSSGLNVVEKIAKAGVVDNGAGEKSKPKLDVKVENLTVTGPATPTPSGSAPATAPSGGTPTAAATATGTPSASS